MKEYLQRFKNPGTILAICSVIGLILVQFGIDIDLTWFDTTVKLFCSLGVLAGILNNPTTDKVDLPWTVSKTDNGIE